MRKRTSPPRWATISAGDEAQKASGQGALSGPPCPGHNSQGSCNGAALSYHGPPPLPHTEGFLSPCCQAPCARPALERTLGTIRVLGDVHRVTDPLQQCGQARQAQEGSVRARAAPMGLLGRLSDPSSPSANSPGPSPSAQSRGSPPDTIA